MRGGPTSRCCSPPPTTAPGSSPRHAAELAGRVRARYVDPTRVWELFPDTRPVLERLREDGWRHVVLSNHVPELPAIAAGLGLTPLVDHIVSSAATGYEKPHPEAFRLALELCGNPEEVWMVGDNPRADVAGAEAVGIPAVLVRTQHEPAKRIAADLYEAAATITRHSESLRPADRPRPAPPPIKGGAASPPPSRGDATPGGRPELPRDCNGWLKSTERCWTFRPEGEGRDIVAHCRPLRIDRGFLRPAGQGRPAARIR